MKFNLQFMTKSLFITFLLSSFVLGCASSAPTTNSQLESTASNYEALVDQNTQNTKLYDGFMNTLDMSATLLNTPVVTAQVEKNSAIYQWTPENRETEKSKALGELQKESQLFLSFFVPEKKHDDLYKTTSKWKIFLDVKGRRYEGKATRIKMLLIEAQTLYPHHTRWQTAYKLSFPVPMNLIEKEEMKLTVTGPVGSASLAFPPAQ